MADDTPRPYPLSTAWAAKLRDYVLSLDESNTHHDPQFRNDQWRNVFEHQVASTPITAAFVGESNSLFTLPLGEDMVKWHIWLDREALWNRLRALGSIAILADEKLKVR